MEWLRAMMSRPYRDPMLHKHNQIRQAFALQWLLPRCDDLILISIEDNCLLKNPKNWLVAYIPADQERLKDLWHEYPQH
jgi:hypothetical protein